MAATNISTQQYLNIAEIKENTVILKDGTLRAVLLCSSVNFSLKSEDEQEALISGYIQFLNSLDHPLQIVIQSRKLDIEGYNRRLRDAQKKQTNELLKMQIDSYVDFINELVELGEIMTKRFFMIIPYNPLGDKSKSFWARFKEAFSSSQIIKLKKEKFAEYKVGLERRIANVQSNLRGMGLESALLDTQGLIELYYDVYNPKTSQNQRLKDINKLGLEE